MSQNRDRCGVTDKDRYPTKEGALDSLKGYAGWKGARGAYRCMFCDAYHTSSGKRGNRKKKK